MKYKWICKILILSESPLLKTLEPLKNNIGTVTVWYLLEYVLIYLFQFAVLVCVWHRERMIVVTRVLLL